MGGPLAGCAKQENPLVISQATIDAQKKIDDDAILAYLTRNNITNARRLDSGIYLVPVTEGPASNPLIKTGQKITVNYVGRFIGEGNQSQVFDASSTNRTECGCFVYYAGQVSVQAPAGVQQATLEMRQGDRKLLLIPSYLGYGFAISGTIPANTPLLFDLEILNVE